MTWHEDCPDFDSRIEAASKDAIFNDSTFLLLHPDTDNPSGDLVSANKAILSLISPVFFAQFYGPLAQTTDAPVKVVDGTAKAFKQLINFICNPNTFNLQVDDITEVFDISFFAHKYQIGPLISLCRQFLGNFDRSEKVTETLNWALSSQNGSDAKTAFPSEHALLVYSCWREIDSNFEDIFPDGEVKDDRELLDEEIMLKVLRKVEENEETILLVILNYYCKLMEKDQKVLKNQKRIKLNNEKAWTEIVEKIKSVVTLKEMPPKLLAEILKKFEGKIPEQALFLITKQMAIGWENKDERFYSNYKESARCNFSFEGGMDADDRVHDSTLASPAQIKFKTNRDAILHFDKTGPNIITCSCNKEKPKADCCIYDSLVVQSQGDFKEEVSIRKKKWNGRKNTEPEFNFYVKEPGCKEEVTLSYRRQCNKEACSLHLQRITDFLHHDEEYEYFEVQITEVNGQPVTEPCYSFLYGMDFSPIYL